MLTRPNYYDKKILNSSFLILPLLTTVFLVPLLLSSCKESVSEKQGMVQIFGAVPTTRDSSYVSFNRSVDQNPQNYFFMYDSVQIKNKKFGNSFGFDGTGMIMLISEQNFARIRLICQEGDSIRFEITRNEKGWYIPSFRGSNAEGHELFYTSKLFRINRLSELIEETIVDENYPENEIIPKIEALKDSLFAPMDSLLKSNLITEGFHDLAKKQAESRIVGAVQYVYTHLHGHRSKKPSSDVHAEKILKYFFEKYDPFSDRYTNIDLVARTVNAEAKCRLIEKGILEGIRTDLGLWATSMDENSFAPVELQEKMKALAIDYNIYYGLNDPKTLRGESDTFRKTFPKSPYVETLFERLPSDTEISEKYTFGRYTENKEEFEFLNSFENSDPANIMNKLGGKMILVDLWATWCAPCVEEFNHVNKIRNFLDEKNIELLYISLDALSAEKKWEYLIKKYDLQGSHFLATNTILPYLEKITGTETSISIPRYLLFDKNGVLLDGDLPRPSMGSKMFDRINTLIGPKKEHPIQ